MRIETESLAGNGSSTARTNNGIKPKTFTVNMLVAFVDAQNLKQLITTAEATNDNGDLVIYDAVDTSINVANVRQVQFNDNVSWRAMPQMQAWSVTFSLVEYNSVPERKEERTTPEQAPAQTSDGDVIEESPATNENGESNDEEPEQELTGFETFLSKVDKALE